MPKFSSKFNKLIDFIQFTHEFREVVRVSRPPNSDRYENDAEHSYQLAMVAWYIIENDGLKLDKELCFMYALAHDLVEIYAGDTYVFDKDKDKHSTKEDREKCALKKIEKRFPQFKALSNLIKDYEKKDDQESKFIYALDKLIPPIQIYLEDGKLWHENNVSFEMLEGVKSHKISISRTVNDYWGELLKELSKNRSKLFPG